MSLSIFIPLPLVVDEKERDGPKFHRGRLLFLTVRVEVEV